MRTIVLLFAVTCFVACNSSQTKEGATDESSKMAASADVTYPYPISYSSKFEMGDPKNSQMVLGLWKDFDNNELDKAKENFADTIVLDLSDVRLSGTRDSIVNSTKAYRGMYKSVESRVAAIMSVKATATNEDWVLVWGTETMTDNKNVVDSSHLQETWRINKDGKVDYMMQYKRKALPGM